MPLETYSGTRQRFSGRGVCDDSADRKPVCGGLRSSRMRIEDKHDVLALHTVGVLTPPTVPKMSSSMFLTEAVLRFSVTGTLTSTCDLS